MKRSPSKSLKQQKNKNNNKSITYYIYGLSLLQTNSKFSWNQQRQEGGLKVLESRSQEEAQCSQTGRIGCKKKLAEIELEQSY